EGQRRLVFERRRIGEIDDNVRAVERFGQALAGYRIDAGARRGGQGFVPLAVQDIDDFRPDQAGPTDDYDLHASPRSLARCERAPFRDWGEDRRSGGWPPLSRGMCEPRQSTGWANLGRRSDGAGRPSRGQPHTKVPQAPPAGREALFPGTGRPARWRNRGWQPRRLGRPDAETRLIAGRAAPLQETFHAHDHHPGWPRNLLQGLGRWPGRG